ncbi:MAG: hypothetical protein ACJAWV_004521 [Flammeovirgaceae bacterium]|jgi:hypothetical protein
MIQEDRIITECFADKAVFEWILGKSIRKANGCNGVIGEVKTEPLLKNQCLIGVIDNDKNKPGSYLYFEQIETKESLILLKIPNTNRFLIEVQPKAIEKWLTDCAELGNVNMADFGLENTIKGLKRTTKKQNVQGNSDFKNFVSRLIELDLEPVQDFRQMILEVLSD